MTRWGVFTFWAAVLAATCAVVAGPPAFTTGTLLDIGSPGSLTNLAFGPDNRLYVTERYGRIHAYTIDREGAGMYRAIDHEVIDLIRTIQNHDDDGTPNPGPDRQMTGLLVTGTPTNPVLYVTSSDWRVGEAEDTGLDTNSGVISRLTWNGSSWDKLDLVRGLPRNEENHSTNGLALDPSGTILYVAQGGSTNQGAPALNFSFLPEVALSACILSVDLAAIGESTYDLPTLDDPDRPGVMDANDPFGGNNANNQAVIVAGGPVQVYAPGFRNPYDIVRTQAGRLYTVDNGSNAGWGGPPTDCTHAVVEGGLRHLDGLHYIAAPGYYGGHPNPTRANAANLVNGQSPILAENPVECDYLIPGIGDAALHTFSASTNGIAEYTASNFNGQLQDNLLAVSFSGTMHRIVLNAAGDDVLSVAPFFTGIGAVPLDVTTVGDAGPFPGTIWVACLSSANVHIFEPDDYACVGGPPNDQDGDGYLNDDEAAAGSDPCDAQSLPADFDGDFISDRTDTDDDDDGIDDVLDSFARDAADGLTTFMPQVYDWTQAEPGFGLFGFGFTGLMRNGADYLDLYSPSNIDTANGLTNLQIDSGDAFAAQNEQHGGFQFGVNVDVMSGPFVVHTRVAGPFFSGTSGGSPSMGLFIGTGDQDNFVKLVISPLGGGLVELSQENAGTYALSAADPITNFASALFIDLKFSINPVGGSIQAWYSVNGGETTALGAQLIPGPALMSVIQGSDALAVGVIATSRGTVPYAGRWELFEVIPIFNDVSATVTIDPVGASIDASTYNPGAFRITNTSAAAKIESVTLDLSSALLPDMIFDPLGTAGDLVAKPLTIDSEGDTAFASHSFIDSFHNGIDGGDGYDQVQLTFTGFDPGDTFTFSIDNDPTSIKSTTAPGPNEAGSVSGLELIGAWATIQFSDGTILSAQPRRLGATLDASTTKVAHNRPPAPTITIAGIPGSNVVNNAKQLVHIEGEPGATVQLMRAEGAMFINGSPNGMSGPWPMGYDIDPLEANSVVSVASKTVTLDAAGAADVTIFLTRFNGDGSYTLGSLDVTGLNTIVAWTDDGAGLTSDLSNKLVMRYIPGTTGFGGGPGPVGAGDAVTMGATGGNSTSGLHATGDVNGDGAVDASDLCSIIGSMGSCQPCPADLNGDGAVDAADVRCFVDMWRAEGK